MRARPGTPHVLARRKTLDSWRRENGQLFPRLYAARTMPELPVRRLLIDLDTPVPRHWCGGDAFLSAWFNALSMGFPVGEQFFIDSVREAAQALPEAQRAAWEAQLKGFVGQEATHRRIHALFNAQIERHGLVNGWGPRAQQRMKQVKGQDPRHALAVTAANEHLTALLAEWVLAHPEVFAGTEPRLQALWSWHAAEEVEHKSTAFDLYQALGGSHAWRVRWMRRTVAFFLLDALRQTASNLRRDGTLWHWSSWRSAARHLLGRGGMLRANAAGWRAYFRSDFHPSQASNEASALWLREHSALFARVGSD